MVDVMVHVMVGCVDDRKDGGCRAGVEKIRWPEKLAALMARLGSALARAGYKNLNRPGRFVFLHHTFIN